jgi:hypothetical protein
MIVEPSGPAFCASCCLFPRVSRAQARSGAAAEGPAAGLVLRLDPGGACARFARSILGNRFGIGIATSSLRQHAAIGKSTFKNKATQSRKKALKDGSHR